MQCETSVYTFSIIKSMLQTFRFADAFWDGCLKHIDIMKSDSNGAFGIDFAYIIACHQDDQIFSYNTGYHRVVQPSS